MKYLRFLLLKKLLRSLSFQGYVFLNPFYLQVETTTACNLNCSMCDSSVRNRKWDYQFMPVDFFKKIINQLPFLKYLNLTGIGEPLLNKNIFEMVNIASKKKINVHFSTNATIINYDIADRLIRAGLYSICFSIDAADKQNYEKIRKGSSFEKVIENIKIFIEKKKILRSKILTQIYCVGTKENLQQIPKIVELGAELGIDHIRVQALYDHSGKNREILEQGLYSKSIVYEAKQIIEYAKRVASLNKISFAYSPLDPVKNVACYMPFYISYITFEGFVTPCCLHGVDPRVINFGNLHDLPFKEIWNSKKYRDFRIRLLSSVPPKICINCPRLKGLL